MTRECRKIQEKGAYYYIIVKVRTEMGGWTMGIKKLIPADSLDEFIEKLKKSLAVSGYKMDKVVVKAEKLGVPIEIEVCE